MTARTSAWVASGISLAREFMPEHGQVLAHLHIDLPDHRDYRGASYLPVFERVVRSFGQWLVQEV